MRFRSPLSFLCTWESTIGRTSKTPSKDLVLEGLYHCDNLLFNLRKFEVTGIFPHEDFDHTLRQNDIALLKTSEDFEEMEYFALLICSTMCYVIIE